LLSENQDERHSLMNRLVASDAENFDDHDAGDSMSSGSRELERQLEEESENLLITWEQM
jgi:hypothetical protein